MSEEKKPEPPDELTTMRVLRNRLEGFSPQAARRVLDWLNHWNNEREGIASIVPGPLEKNTDPRRPDFFGGS